MLGFLIGIYNAIGTAVSPLASFLGIHSAFGGMRTAKKVDALIEEFHAHDRRVTAQIEKLTDGIYYAPSVQQVRTLCPTTPVTDRKALVQAIQPLRDRLQTEMLLTAVRSTPRKLREAFNNNPWKVLMDIRPITRASRSDAQNPDLVPVLFSEDGIDYLGWQMQGALAVLLDCEFDPVFPGMSPTHGIKPFRSIHEIEATSPTTLIEAPDSPRFYSFLYPKAPWTVQSEAPVFKSTPASVSERWCEICKQVHTTDKVCACPECGFNHEGVPCIVARMLRVQS